MKKLGLIIVALVLAVVGVVWFCRTDRERAETSGAELRDATPESGERKQAREIERVESSGEVADEVQEEPQYDTEEERLEAEAEVKVEAFDNLVDRWVEPAEKSVSMDEIGKFVAAFHQVPKDRQDECVHRALNLVPDENVMLLAGILLDKTLDKEIVETVFNDILNRDESVKKPILQQVFKDRTHPCWADTAWILDVTGELPSKP